MKEKTREKMMSIYNFIKGYIMDKNYPPTVREICSQMEIKSTATVNYYINLMEEENLITKRESKNRAIELVENQKVSKAVNVPLLGRIAAGVPITAEENFEETYPLPAEMFDVASDLYMLTVCGDSMVDVGIYDGDKIVVRKQSTAENGEIVAAMVDGEATVKRFFKKDDHIILRPENQNMEDMVFDSVEILGIIVGLLRKM